VFVNISTNINKTKPHRSGSGLRDHLECGRGFESRSGQIKDYKIGISCFSCEARSIKEKEQRLVGTESE